MRTFICEHCKGEFQTEEPEQVALDECKEIFGAVPDDKVSLCDDCFKMIMRWYRTKVH